MRRWRTFADVTLLINPTCAPPTCYVAANTVAAYVVIFLYSFTYFFQLSCSYKQQNRNYCNINSPAWCRSEIICIYCISTVSLISLLYCPAYLFCRFLIQQPWRSRGTHQPEVHQKGWFCVQKSSRQFSLWVFCSFGVAFVSRLLHFCINQQLWESFICFFLYEKPF